MSFTTNNRRLKPRLNAHSRPPPTKKQGVPKPGFSINPQLSRAGTGAPPLPTLNSQLSEVYYVNQINQPSIRKSDRIYRQPS
ncbi:MAG: hypothetical protein ACRC62_24640 [Microcoleus sp.]